jgi:integrase
VDDSTFRKHDSQDPMTPGTFTWRFKLILKKNGPPERLNVHSLRHSNASLLIANGAGVAAVAVLPGHSQPSAALDIYTHLRQKQKKPPAKLSGGAWISDEGENCVRLHASPFLNRNLLR